MNTLEIWLVAIGLSMDCLAVSIASGILLKCFRGRPIVIMAFFFALFQTIMPMAGWLFSRLFSHYVEDYDHWVAFAILAFLGIKMIRDSCSKEEEAHFDPTCLKTVIALSVATSIDALAVGISFACLGMRHCTDILTPVGIIGLVAFLFSIVGFSTGILFGRRFDLKADLLGGIILIGIGAKIVFEHLYL